MKKIVLAISVGAVVALPGTAAGFGPQSVAVQLAADDGDLAQIVRALDAADVRISHLQIHEPTLDDVFLDKTGRHLEGAGDDAETEEAAS